MNSFERFDETGLCDEKCFFSSLKKGKIDNDGNKMDGHINDKDYLVCKQIW